MLTRNLPVIGVQVVAFVGVAMADGDFDAAFGTAGFIPVDQGVNASAPTPDGGIVFARVNTEPGPEPDVLVYKVDATGQNDVAFGDGGSRQFNPSTGPERVHDVAVDNAGNIFILGTTGFDPNAGTYVTKLTSAGNLDPGYGIGGTGGAAIRNLVEPLVAEVQADGKLVVAARQGVVFRITTDGARDIDTFSPGRGIVDLPDQIGATGLAIDSAGRLVISGLLQGLLSSDSSQVFRVLRFLPDGSADPSFGIGGRVDLPLGVSVTTSLSTDVAVDELDRVYVTGIYQSGPVGSTVSGSALLRLQADGQVDTSFGEDGVSWLDVPDRSAVLLQQIVRQQDGRILVGGDALEQGSGVFCDPPPRYEFFVVAVLPDGRFDQDFGLGGWQEGQLSPATGCFQAVFYGSDPTLDIARLADKRIAGRSFGELGVLTTDPAGNAMIYANPTDWIDQVEPGSVLTFEGIADPGGFEFVGWPGRYEEFGLTIQNNSQMFVQNNDAYGTGAFLSPQGASPQVVDLTFPAGTRAFSLLAGPAGVTVSVNGEGAFAVPAPLPGFLSFFGVTNDEVIRTARVVTPGAGFDLDLVAFTSGLVSDPTDSDSDGVPDASDNCIEAANGPDIPDTGGNVQLDSDADGFGNACDADLDNNGFVNFADLASFKTSFGAAGSSADLDGSGFVSFADLARFKELFGQPPGPSGLVP